MFNQGIAAVIVTHNRLELLKKCILSLINQSSPLSKIYVVNSGSTDETLEWLGKQKEIFVINQSNQGSSGGFYSGISAAYNDGQDWIWLMDDDCELYQDSLERLIESFKKFPNH